MSQKKQTARKTTGKHLELTAALNRRSTVSKSASAKRVRHARTTATAAPSASTGPSGPRSKASPTKSILRPNLGVAPPVSPPIATNLSTTSLTVNDPPSTSDQSNGTTLISGQAAGHLDKPISLWTRFATWIENQECVHEDELARAVEREGKYLLSLAKATIMFDNALRGSVPPCTNGVASPLIEHARTLRVFAELLRTKMSDGSLSEELKMAVLRDGDALIRLAQCCLDFGQAIRGSGSATRGGS